MILYVSVAGFLTVRVTKYNAKDSSHYPRTVHCQDLWQNPPMSPFRVEESQSGGCLDISVALTYSISTILERSSHVSIPTQKRQKRECLGSWSLFPLLFHWGKKENIWALVGLPRCTRLGKHLALTSR